MTGAAHANMRRWTSVTMIEPESLRKLANLPEPELLYGLKISTSHRVPLDHYLRDYKNREESLPETFNEQAYQRRFEEQKRWIESKDCTSRFQSIMKRLTSCQHIRIHPTIPLHTALPDDKTVQRFVDIILTAVAEFAQVETLEVSIPGLRLDMLSSSQSTFANFRHLSLLLDVSELEPSEEETWGSTFRQLLQQCQQLTHLRVDLQKGAWPESDDEPIMFIPKLESLTLRSLS